jgi:phosphoribosylanthranilate isomerase
MKLKICGMKYPENILEVAALLPDYILYFGSDRLALFWWVKSETKIHKKTGYNESVAIIIEKILENNFASSAITVKNLQIFA